MDYIPESPYERMRPLREDFNLRLNTFSNFPRNSPVKPLDLVRDYFYYIGIEDKCQCTHCGGVLGGWMPGDDVHREHRKHFPDCPYMQQCLQNPHPIISLQPLNQSDVSQEYNSGQSHGHNFGHQHQSSSGAPVAMETTVSQETPADKPGVTRPKYREYSLEQTRLSSYTGWPSQMKQKPENLSKAGFFYLGQGDKVKCFFCGGILWDWDPTDEPYTEHAKWFPKCPWLSLSKGDAFVDRVQKDLMTMNIAESTEQTAAKTVEETQPKEIPEDSQPSTSAQAAVNPEKKFTPQQHLNEKEQLNVTDIIAENRRIKEEKQCKICMDEDVSVVFFPCGHLSCCPKCAVALDKCPICRKDIEKQVKIYW